MKRMTKYLLLTGLLSLILTGCGGSDDKESDAAAKTEQAVEATAETEEAEKNEEGSEDTSEASSVSLEAGTGLSELMGLLGMKDEATAELFGGGEENWTEDKSFYIGRIYDIMLDGEDCQVFTTCGDDKTVESVSIWVISGEREVTEEDAFKWSKLITELVGAEPVTDDEPSEGGSINSRWNKDGLAVSMNRMKDILTISLQPAVGELYKADAGTMEENNGDEPSTAEEELNLMQVSQGYKDNYDVDGDAVSAFAKSIKAAVESRDLEALSELISFPVYIGLDGIGGVETKDELMSIGDRLFTDELAASVGAADEEALSPSEAGFVLSDGGTANVIFGVMDGELTITGINY